jgi:hypothetical protein
VHGRPRVVTALAGGVCDVFAIGSLSQLAHVQATHSRLLASVTSSSSSSSPLLLLLLSSSSSQVLEVPVEYEAVDRVIAEAAVDKADIALVIHVGVGHPGAIALEQ